MLTKDTKLRFWCQKVLPLVYDDSLSYYELLNKVVLHLNQHTEDINALIDFYDTFAEDVEDIIRQMMEDGDFNEIVADTLGSIVAEEYDPTKSYIIFDYCIFESKLYRANSSTTGVFDPEKWDERTVGYDLTTIQNYIYSLNAGNVTYDENTTYESGTVGNKIKNLNANEVQYNSSATYNDGTVGKELSNLNNAIIRYNARAIVDPANLTDSWLLSANSGEYEINGTSTTGSFIEGVDTTYGVMKVVFTPDFTGSNSIYGYIEYVSTSSNIYVRSFRRDPSAIVWRTNLKRISNYDTTIITSDFFLNNPTNNPDSINEDRCAITVRNGHISGSLVLKCDKELALNNLPIGYVPSQYTPLVSAYYPAFIQPTEWGMASEQALTAYVNTSRQIILNWGITPAIGKRLAIVLNYDY